METKYSKICVVCLSEDNLKLMCPDNVRNKENEDYFMMYKNCFNLKFPRTNRFGRLNKMCVVCIEKLRQSYEFRKVSDLAHRRLYSHILDAHILDWHKDTEDPKEGKKEIEIKVNNRVEILDIKKEEIMLDQDVDNSGDVFINDMIDNVDADYGMTIEKFPVDQLQVVDTMQPQKKNKTKKKNSNVKRPIKIMDLIQRQIKKNKKMKKIVAISKLIDKEKVNDDDDGLSDCSTNTEEIYRATGYYSNANKLTQPSDKNVRPVLEPGSLTCPVCNEEFTNHHNTKIHYISHYPNYMCYVCGKAISSRDRYRIHLESHYETDTTHVCKPCNKTFKSKDSLRCHIKYIHEGIKCAKCYHCPAQFTGSLSRIIHMYKVHNIQCKFFYCNKCELKFYSGAKLRLHERRVHSRIMKFFCDICSKGFYTKTELKDHLRFKHVDEAELPHCEFCGKKISSAKNLTEHLKIHLNIKKFKCVHCDKAFVQKSSLDWHLKKCQQAL